MTKTFHCWWGKHDAPASEFSPTYLKQTYNSAGRICKKCAKERAEERKQKKEQARKEQEYFYGMRF